MVDVKTKIISEENDAVKKGITAMKNKIDNTAAFQQLADARISITDDLEAQEKAILDAIQDALQEALKKLQREPRKARNCNG